MTTAYPLSWPSGWPRATARKPSQFRTGYKDAYDNLLRELDLMKAGGVLVSSNAPLRRDGRPYSKAMADDLPDPGVAVYFTLQGQPRVMARDGHPTPAENLHAIGHVIAHLRGLNRHGGAYMMARAFSGFTALAAPKSWSDVLGVKPSATPAEIDAAFRQKAKTAHPDAGGSTAAMADLNAARDAALRERS